MMSWEAVDAELDNSVMKPRLGEYSVRTGKVSISLLDE